MQKSTTELAKVYAIVTQGFIIMLVLAGIGFLIGYFLIKSNIWAGVLAVIGALLGVMIFIQTALKLKLGGDSNRQT